MYSTHTLFTRIAQRLNADLICDIGCFDAADTIEFRKYFTDAKIIGFEANPANLSRINANPEISKKRLTIYPLAVSDSNGELTFYCFNDGDSEVSQLGSTKKRNDVAVDQVLHVKCVRLDDFILQNYPEAKRIVLWIDVEGASDAVFRGMEKIRDRVMLIHTEIEVNNVFENSFLKKDAQALLREFEEIGFIPHASNLIGDAVYLKKDFLKEFASYIKFLKLKSSLSSRVSLLRRKMGI